MLISTQVDVVVDAEIELGKTKNKNKNKNNNESKNMTWEVAIRLLYYVLLAYSNQK